MRAPPGGDPAKARKFDRPTKPIAPEDSAADAALEDATAVYSGRNLIGHYSKVAGYWRAWNADGLLLGIVDDRDAARRTLTHAAVLGGARAE
jgi:hypothetical protein